MCLSSSSFTHRAVADGQEAILHRALPLLPHLPQPGHDTLVIPAHRFKLTSQSETSLQVKPRPQMVGVTREGVAPDQGQNSPLGRPTPCRWPRGNSRAGPQAFRSWPLGPGPSGPGPERTPAALTPHSSCRAGLSARCRRPCPPAADGGCSLRSLWPEHPVQNRKLIRTRNEARPTHLEA